VNYILAAIFSNLSYAIADNANGIISKHNKPLKIATWVSITGAIVFAIPLVLFFRNEIARLTLLNILLLVIITPLVSLGYLSFVKGMSLGSVTLTGVIGGSFPALTTLLALFLFHEHLTAIQALAVVLVVAGIVLSSLEDSPRTVLKAIKGTSLFYALGAFLLWGIYYAVVRFPVDRIGWFIPQYSSSIAGLILFPLIAKRSGEKEMLKPPKLLLLIAAIALLQIGGGMFYSYAISKGSTALVAPIAGSSPAIFVVLAYFIFKEKLKAVQWIGIACAVIGIVGLSLSA
jgi:drug/metabolite transporter (DMT)-like permease